MFERLLRFSITQRWLIMMIILGVIALGFYNLQRLSVDAVPDITNVQVQINTAAPGYSPLETEQLVTFPVELAMLGAPKLKDTWSISKYGLSQVTVIFEEGTDLYFARQQVAERIQQVKGTLPVGIEPKMGPVATGLGEIFLWSLTAKPDSRQPDGRPVTDTYLRTLQDWVIRPQLLTLPGVTEINSIGGYKKQYHVTPNPQQLIAYGLGFSDIMRALSENNQMAGAGYIESHGEQFLIRVPGRVYTLDEIRGIRVGTYQGTPIYVRDVADVLLGQELRTGAATRDGQETVIGTAFMLWGENSRAVAQAVREKLDHANQFLPPDVQAKPFYDRTVLVDKTIATVEKNLLEGATLVIIVLFILLGNIRAALITTLVIPLAMLLAFTGMASWDISANLMSLGALDFGIIVDGAVVIVENSVRHLATTQKRLGRTLTLPERLDTIFAASEQARRAILFGQLIIMAVYFPIFALTGVEGKMFHPMAQTVVLALAGALLLSVTFVPAACAIFFNGNLSDKENSLIRLARKAYRPALDWTLANPAVTITSAATLVVVCGLLTTRMGTEFMPTLDEGDIALQVLRAPGTGLNQSIAMQENLEKVLKTFPEVKTIAARIGTAEVATDVMGPNISDSYVILKPRREWPDPERSKEDLIAAMDREAGHLSGANYEFSQPIEMRFNELLSGVRADVAIKVFGDDMAVLRDRGRQIAVVLGTVPGAVDVRVEQVSGLPILTVHLKRDQLARYDLNTAAVQRMIQVAMGGQSTGKIYQGDRRFDLVVRLPETYRLNAEALKRLPILLPDRTQSMPTNTGQSSGAAYITLSTVATIEVLQGPNQISRENSKRRLAVTFNVRGRDLGSVVAEAKAKIRSQVAIPPGYWTDWGGRFQLMTEAAQRLAFAVPFALLAIFILLYSTFGNVKDGLLVFSGVPFALTGGVLSLWLRDMPLSISAGVGFIALSGVAVLNGLVMVSFIRHLRQQNMPLAKAIREGAMTRLRPVLMTALVASLGFIPMALATSAGAEVQRPIATVVIGGILSSTLLTLLVLPVLYQWLADPDCSSFGGNIHQ